MLKGLKKSERSALNLKPAKKYKMLTHGGLSAIDVPGMDDESEFNEAREAMVDVGIEPDAEQFQIFTVLAGLLELGNVQWLENSEGAPIDDLPGFSIIALPKKMDSINQAATHFGLDTGWKSTAQVGFNRSMCYNLSVLTMSTGSMTSVPQDVRQTKDNTSALIKYTYVDLIFFSLVSPSLPTPPTDTHAPMQTLNSLTHSLIHSFLPLLTPSLPVTVLSSRGLSERLTDS